MRKTIASLFLLGIMAFAQAQEITDFPTLEKLKLTSNPAFVILGIEPTNIERPSTPREFIAGVQAGTVNGRLQPNLAMELNPFVWGTLEDPARATDQQKWFAAADYLGSPNWWTNFKKTFGLSFATTSADTVIFASLDAGTGFSYGMKVMLFSGKPDGGVLEQYLIWEKAHIRGNFYHILSTVPGALTNEGIMSARQAISASLEADPFVLPHHRGMLLDMLDKEVAKALRGVPGAQLTVAVAQSEFAIANLEMTQAAERINSKRTPFAKTGFMLELAAAGATVFQGNSWGDAVTPKAALWLTPSYRWDVSTATHIHSIDWLGVLRYTHNDKLIEASSYLDFGTKFQYNYEKFSVSAEGVARWASEKPADTESSWTYRCVANVDYTLMDNITLKLSFGTNFDGNTAAYTDPKQILAVGGLNFGLLK